MLKKFAIALGLLVGSAGLAYATGETVASWFKQSNMNPVLVQGSDGTDAQPLRVSTTGSLFVAGGAADDAAASGNPVPVGGIYNTTRPTYTNLDRTQTQYDARGNLGVALYANAASNDFISTPGDAYTNAFSAYSFVTNGRMFNGATWDRDFTCPLSAPISVASAATTEIVALSASTIVRVCGFVISGDTLATVATFVDGTGTNCGTSPSNMTGAMRLVDEGNISFSPSSGSAFRGRAGRAICLTAATGAVTGLLTYAQY